MKNKYALFFILGTSWYSHAAPPVITVPYRPWPWILYPQAFGALTALCVNPLLKFAAKKQGTQVPSLAIQAVSCLIGYMSCKAMRRNDLDCILIDSAQAFKRLCARKEPKIMGLLADKTDTAFATEYLELIHFNEDNRRTAEENRRIKEENRRTSEATRRTFEKHVDALFDQQCKDSIKKKQTLHYVGFGSNSWVKDFIFIIRALAKNPTAKINIHLIYPSKFTKSAEFIGKLQSKFSNSNLHINIYENIPSYLAKNLAFPADVVVGANITEQQTSINDYAPLLAKSNGNNIIMSNEQNTIALAHFSRRPSRTSNNLPTWSNDQDQLYKSTIPIEQPAAWRDLFTDAFVGAMVYMNLM